MLYWDTSALFKLYVPEPDTPYYLKLIETIDRPILSSAIVSIELLCALHRKQRSGELRPGGTLSARRQFTSDVTDGLVVLVPFGSDVAAEADRVITASANRRRPILIRSLDVIHICSALVSNADALVASDARLREVARLAGLRLLP